MSVYFSVGYVFLVTTAVMTSNANAECADEQIHGLFSKMLSPLAGSFVDIPTCWAHS